MKIVLPISIHDADIFSLRNDAIAHLGNLQSHDLLIVSTPGAQAVAFAEAAKLRAICPQVEVVSMDTSPDGGWPQAPNMQWFWTVNYLSRTGNRQAFLWMEADCIPVAPFWADRIATAYQSCGAPFMGCVVPSPSGAAEDTMMMGCGVYPTGMMTDELISPLLGDLAKRNPNHPTEPWDLYLRWVFKARGVTHTPLIADLWSTGNYRRDGESIICDAVPGAAANGRARSGVVSPEAVLAHGCKDGSLPRLVLGAPFFSASSAAASPGANGEVISSPAPAGSPAAQVAEEHGSGHNPTSAEDWEPFIIKDPTVVVGDKLLPMNVKITPPDTEPLDKKPFPSFLAVRIAKLMADGKKRRHTHLVEELALPAAEIRKIIEAPGSGLYLDAGSWIQIGDKP